MVNLEQRDGIAFLGALGSLAAIAALARESDGGGSSVRDVINIPDGFGQDDQEIADQETGDGDTDPYSGEWEFRDEEDADLSDDDLDFGSSDPSAPDSMDSMDWTDDGTTETWDTDTSYSWTPDDPYGWTTEDLDLDEDTTEETDDSLELDDSQDWTGSGW
jgi:hypothetical protein